VKFGSASVPIYLSESKGRKRYLIAHYRDGKHVRKAFPDLAAAKKEALFVAQRIQSGMQHVTDLKPHERDSYAKASSGAETRAGDHRRPRTRRGQQNLSVPAQDDPQSLCHAFPSEILGITSSGIDAWQFVYHNLAGLRCGSLPP
jgi:hypothetical protein